MSKMEMTEHWVDGEPMIGFGEIGEGPRFPCAGLNCSCANILWNIPGMGSHSLKVNHFCQMSAYMRHFLSSWF